MIHLIKLCVGASSPRDLKEWQDQRPDPIFHTTRMKPKRVEEIIEQSSLYWVISGVIAARQRITGLKAVQDEMGIKRCQIHLDREITLVSPVARRPFQGWRYLLPKDAPEDIGVLGGMKLNEDLPLEIALKLSELGLNSFRNT